MQMAVLDAKHASASSGTQLGRARHPGIAGYTKAERAARCRRRSAHRAAMAIWITIRWSKRGPHGVHRHWVRPDRLGGLWRRRLFLPNMRWPAVLLLLAAAHANIEILPYDPVANPAAGLLAAVRTSGRSSIGQASKIHANIGEHP